MKINPENEALHQQRRYNGTNLLCVREGWRLTALAPFDECGLQTVVQLLVVSDRDFVDPLGVRWSNNNSLDKTCKTNNR